MKMSDAVIALELTEHAESRLDAMLLEITAIREELCEVSELHRKLAYMEERLGALNATNAWQGHELLRLQKERDEYKYQRDTWKQSAFDAEVALEKLRIWRNAVPVADIKYCAHFVFVHDTKEMEQSAHVYEWIEALP